MSLSSDNLPLICHLPPHQFESIFITIWLYKWRYYLQNTGTNADRLYNSLSHVIDILPNLSSNVVISYSRMWRHMSFPLVCAQMSSSLIQFKQHLVMFCIFFIQRRASLLIMVQNVVIADNVVITYIKNYL